LPIRQVKGGWKWGRHGKTYRSRKGAERQAQAAYASGYREQMERLIQRLESPTAIWPDNNSKYPLAYRLARKMTKKQRRKMEDLTTEGISKDGEFAAHIEFSGDDHNGLIDMLNHIKHAASIGHSFKVTVDPDDREYRKDFHFDGDGAFKINDLVVSRQKERRR
jgi:hypothetical protein